MSAIVTWWPARRRLAALAIGTAFLTGSLIATVGGGGAHIVRAGFLLIATIGALRIAALVTAQVVVGMLMIASILPATDLAGGLLLAPAVAGVIVTGELLAAVARLDAPVEREPVGLVPRTLTLGALGGLVYAAVLLVAGTAPLAGGPGLLVSSGAVLMLGLLLLRAARGA